MDQSRRKRVYASRDKSKFLVYVRSSRIPTHFHYDVDKAWEEADRLARLTGRSVTLVEYADDVNIIGRVVPEEETSNG